ncbi:uncharacterized protein LY79DRAFT_538168 [Colletotrichum navitas]|uniref:Uncharacterized protein n=1 Tax=Colletotrichum navitas TaxID=681940 RepID=A0AAD8V904_9PEZI|nr:uncharacterized protein LY79DRAFT_538168 [Colletotrichum navitas]KAK1598772.1 hypothetical protein LY79DRAFT_538168 [Colletotrichum navitas]
MTPRIAQDHIPPSNQEPDSPHRRGFFFVPTPLPKPPGIFLIVNTTVIIFFFCFCFLRLRRLCPEWLAVNSEVMSGLVSFGLVAVASLSHARSHAAHPDKKSTTSSSADPIVRKTETPPP